MARTVAAGFWSLGRAGARALQRGAGSPSSLKAGLILIALMYSGASQAEPVKGEASLSAGDGYARLVFKLAEDVDAEVIAAGSILVVRFSARWIFRSINCPTPRPTMSARRGEIPTARRSGCH
jgi:hypothetical protein